MSTTLGNELGLLRRVVRHLRLRPLSDGIITTEVLRSEGFARGRITPTGLVGLTHQGAGAFAELCEQLLSRDRAIERGTRLADFADELFTGLLENGYLGRDAATVSSTDLQQLIERLAHWFTARAVAQQVYVPCMISPWPSPRFSVGSISFVFIDEVPRSEYYVAVGGGSSFPLNDVDRLLQVMRDERAHWLAVVDVRGCDRKRAQEVADLAVDLAIVAVQVAAPYMGTKNMSRLSDRRGPSLKLTLAKSQGGNPAGGLENVEPGLSIGDGYLGQILRDARPVFEAVGNIVQGFTTGEFRLPKLEQAWCDAAYWLHQGLVEPIDAIAVAKLETAIEILLRAENASGSESKMLAAFEAFYGLKAASPITQNNQTTTKHFVRGFVRDRSRVLHGTWSTLSRRFSTSRDALENVATTLVRATALELDAYVASGTSRDEVDPFLEWIKVERAARATNSN